MNGEIHAMFVKVTEGKPLSFTSMNGEIDVRIPGQHQSQCAPAHAEWRRTNRLRRKGPGYQDGSNARPGREAPPHFPSSADKSDDSDWHDDIRDAVRELRRLIGGSEGGSRRSPVKPAEAAREGVAEAEAQLCPCPDPAHSSVLPSISGGKVVSAR